MALDMCKKYVCFFFTFVSMICVDQSMTVVNPLIISKRDLKMSQIPKFRKFGRHI